jgi:hypothetical protein
VRDQDAKTNGLLAVEPVGDSLEEIELVGQNTGGHFVTRNISTFFKTFQAFKTSSLSFLEILGTSHA